MNAVVKQEATPSFGSALIPQDMDQAIRLAKAMSSAKMMPKHMQDDPGTCLMVIEQAMRWNMSPFAVAQCTSKIGDKLMYEGKLIAAAVSSMGAISGEFDYKFSGDPEKPEGLSVEVSAKRTSDGQIKTLKLAWEKAKTSNAFWKTQPEQQLCYAGARVWARRWTPGAVLGVYAREEFGSEAAEEIFTGTTIEAEPETQREPVRAAAAATPRPERVYATEPPPSETAGNGISASDRGFLDGWQAKFDAAKSETDVNGIETSQVYQQALRNVTNRNKAVGDVLRVMATKAHNRVQPKAEQPIGNAPENATAPADRSPWDDEQSIEVAGA